LHCPLVPATHHLIYSRNLGWMKKSAYLLNLSRGPVVCEGDVAKALLRRQIAGYAADVLSEEPPRPSHPLLQRKLRDRVLLTPHIAWASRESRQRLVDEITQNIRAFFSGKKHNRIV
jgi:glycerate dehydrogenase